MPLVDMTDTRDPSRSAASGSPRSMSPFPKSEGFPGKPGDSSRFSSPLRVGHNANGASDSPVSPTANGVPKITHSAPTGGSLGSSRDQEPSEFPFNVVPLSVDTRPTNEVISKEQSRKTSTGSPSITNGSSGAHPPMTQLTKRPTFEGEESDVPKGRRSVQFARSTTFTDGAHTRTQSWEAEDGEGKGKERERQGSSLMGKLKALAAPMSLQGHGRSLSALAGNASTIHEASPGLSPTSERDELRYDDSEADADAEESANEGPSRPPRARRKSRRWFEDGAQGTQTAPTTPKQTHSHFFSRDSPTITPTTSHVHRPGFGLGRRATMSDIPENQRQGVSEDEGRDRLAKESAWTRGLHSARGLSYGGLRRHDHGAEPEGRRPSNLRRITAFGSGGDGHPSPWRMRGERTSSVSAQKWQRLKSSLKLFGQNRKAERQADHVKSAELMAELMAGVPAALFLASMFQRDEHGHRRIPILLEQLKVTISDTDRNQDGQGERHAVFRIELEYGSGLTRMKWVIHRSLRDFTNLHVKYKLSEGQNKLIPGTSANQTGEEGKRQKLPRFPKSAFPYMRGLRGYGALDDEEEEDEEAAAAAQGPASGPDGEASGAEPPRAKRRKSSFHLGRRKSSIGSPDQPGGVASVMARQGSFAGQLTAPSAKQTYAERQRKKLEKYLNSLITWLIFRPDSNRLCKFLELSALGVRLSAEGGYHGKEGFMMIKSGKGVDHRRKWAPQPLIQRHSPKWFLVRHSYVVCIESPEEMNVYDVFLVDSDFAIETKKNGRFRDKKAKDIASEAKASATHPGHHQLRLINSERRLKLLAKNERQLQQFEDSIKFMRQNTVWGNKHRFDSFAPVRKKIYAQWLVDGRDYMWNVSRAINMAKDVIYIHDWWLSPELYMRRPPAISQKWRLDRLLQRKAQEGVKIFVIMYRNINTAIPIDSEYSKFSLLDLHPNVFVQRSPNQIRQNTFFWAHHEKICVVDHTIAFCGGVDLCFGRWDTPQHSVVDDKLTGFELNDNPKDADHVQLWPGKDYSNPRVQDFYNLDKPYEEMYNRTKVPRMPWHDIGMQIVGQPARDLTRHFVQRWNYLLRQRKPSRPTPFLLPPPDFNPADIEALGLDGTCEIQILRSACAWSLGTPNRTEHSIQNAYVQMISTSEHFVYIENQFFISSCEVLGTKIENKIGDALVDRIKRAYRNQEDWRACLVIPLMPGFQNTVDSQDGSSVRLIMTCQYRSICRGETSIFARLRAAGIEPEDYIHFYALRSWGALGPNKALVSEQLYIHAKCMIVDDRVAIIGSANINERSMLGSRDSEVAAVVRDTELIDSYMAGEPYKVGRFPHTLRMRLMREHLGIDTDDINEDEAQTTHSDAESSQFNTESSAPSSPSADRETTQKLTENKHRLQDDLIARAERLHSFNHDVDWEQGDNPYLKANKKPTTDSRIQNNKAHAQDVRGEGVDHMLHLEHERPAILHGRDSYVNEKGQEVLLSDVAAEGLHETPKKSSMKKTRSRSGTAGTRGSAHSRDQDSYAGLPPPKMPRMDTRMLGMPLLSQLPALPISDDTDIGGPPLQRTFSYASSSIINPLLADMRRPVVNADCMKDPLNDGFYQDIWHAVAENNTKLFRQVFRCQPDNEVKTWKEYKEYMAFEERFAQSQGTGKSTERKQQEAPAKTGPPGTGISATTEKVASLMSPVSKHIDPLSEKLNEKLSRDGTSAGDANAEIRKVEQWAAEQEKSVNERVNATDEKAVHQGDADRDGGVSPVAPTPNQTFTFPPPPPVPDTEATDFATMANGHANGSASRPRTVTISEPKPPGRPHSSTVSGSRKGRRRATTKSSTKQFNHMDDNILLNQNDARNLLDLVQGHLVLWPYEWLEKEEANGGWLYTVDQIAPLEIYT